MNITSPSYGTVAGTASGMVQYGSGNISANLVIEELDEFSAGVYATCGTVADYVSCASSAAVGN